MKRDQISTEQVNERIHNQAADEEKQQQADFIIDTTDGKSWRNQITTLIDILIHKQ